ncbi:hypothetical protein L596_026869 [Steinernema carpocapsae]|uniref:C-factor n=1 Tax=Steinernema carpocapsae TaxID=34508 RepID=A0A4U5M2P6_STECR|nr:hypothetical protein L596_026869 [Steinernema carpocapsae]
MPANILITGSNRGIGFGLVKRALRCKDVRHVFATCRNPKAADELQLLHQSDQRVQVIQLDGTNDRSIKASVNEVSKIVGNQGLNLLINNAGISEGTFEAGSPSSFLGASQGSYMSHFNINSVAPVLITKEFLPLLTQASNSFSEKDVFSIHRAAVLNISSMLGSIEANTTGSANIKNLAYRMSKSALNQFGKNVSIDLKERKILVASFCPGWVRTDMGTASAELGVTQSTEKLWETFLTLDESTTGAYLDRFGKQIAF